MAYNIKQYESLEEFKYPLKLKSGITIDQLIGMCPDCNKNLCDLRGEIIEYNNCSEVKLAGLCHPCKTLVTCQMRYYKDGRIMQNISGGWEKPIVIYNNFFYRLKNKIKSIFKKNK